ncbi:DUF500-domain-containing protein [Violaceomyces palustris]|uniref:DUF500-domain-containing protein n=1 Tax=Violaceomyces palustris TaxID=1673888 RepID=A0ACD0P645_9BASI|nr:DUF500-domain-containing protein [Violaceomyces palustris]
MSRDAPSLPPKDPPLPSTSSPSSSSSSPSHSPQQGSSRWGRWGKVAFDKSIKVSDWAAGYANAGSAKFGAERFFPKSNDFQEELDKCERILRAFTVEGVAAEVKETEVPDGKGSFMKKKRKVLKKIPPSLILRAKGILIYTAMRSGIAPLGGAGGVGLMLARLPDGSWSAPSAITPNNLALGLLLGVDIFDAVLLVNTDRAMESFKSHKVTIGAETAVAAGPFGAGASAEVGVKDRSPVFSYVRSRGLYAGAEAMAQVFLHRFDENERIYYWPGITARDILEGRVRIPPNVGPLHRALRDAETGVAQGDSLEKTIYETVKVPPSLAMKRLASTDSDDLLEDGEKLKLPPTPEELEAMERAGIPDEDDLEIERRELQEKLEAQERERQEIRALPPPPRHPYVVKYWNLHPAPGSRRLAPASSSGSETFAPSPLKHVTFSQVDPAEVELPPSPDLPAQREEEQQEQRLREGAKGVDQEGDEGVDEGELEQVDMHRETSDEVVGVPAIQELELSSLRAEEVSQHGPESRSLDQASQSPMGRSPIRPSRPPRARPVSAVASGCSSPGTPRAKVVLLLDYDETITREDTLSLISPPPKEEGGGKPFSHYSELYVEELTKLKERFGERESWEREMEYMRELDEEVEWKVTKQIEEGGLFKGERLEDLLERSSKVEFREGWEEFDDWILKREEEEEEEGKVEIETEIISIGWSARFIRESIERGRKRRERSSPSQVPRRIFSNEVEMKPDPLGQDVGTGRLETKRKGMRTGLDKLERLNQIVKDRDGLTTIYVGDSRTDLACLLQADYGVLLGDPERTRPIREALVRFGGSERLIELQDVLAGKARKEGGNLLVLSHWNQVLRLVQTLAE